MAALPTGTVNIHVDGKTIPCEKELLSKNSAYFLAMFNSGMMEAQNNEVTLHGQIDGAVSNCQLYLLKTLDNSNCLQLMSMARSYLLPDPYNLAKQHSLYYFTAVTEQPQFCDLDLEMVQEYLSEETLTCEGELEVLDAIHAWYTHNPAVRAADLPLLHRCVRHSTLTEEGWGWLSNHPLITDTEQGAVWYERILQTKGAPQQQKIRQVPTSIYLLGGEYYSEDEECRKPQDSLFRLGPGENQFKPVKKLSELYNEISCKMGFRATVVGKDLYLTGGVEKLVKSKFITDVVKYDSFYDKWDVATSLPLPRRNHAACSTGSSLFLIGGFGKYRKKLCSVQQYNTQTDEWTDLPSLPQECNAWQAVCSPCTLYVLTDVCVCLLHLEAAHWTMYDTLGPIEHSDLLQTPILVDDELYLFPAWSSESTFLCLTIEGDTLCVNGDEINVYSNFLFSHWRRKVYDAGVSLGKSVVAFNHKFYTVTADAELSLLRLQWMGIA